MHEPITDKCFIVTGSTSGIGQSVCYKLVQEGGHVLMASRNEGKLKALQQSLQSQFPQAQVLYQVTDVTDREQVQAMVDYGLQQWQHLDGLINCAGVMYYTYMQNLHIDEWLETIDVNCKGPVHTIGATLNALKASQGHIINITSDAARSPFPGLAVYSGSKSFLEFMSRAMRLELADAGVKITTIQPGNVNTNLFSHTTDEQAWSNLAPGTEQYILDPANIADAIYYALSKPANMSVNEIMVQPSDQPV